MSKGEIIKKLITESGLPITEIARRIQVDRRTIYSYMKKDNWKPETLRQISIACDKDPNYLLRMMLDLDGDPKEEMNAEEPSTLYQNTKNSIQEIDLLQKENTKLLRKLIALQEKHILLYEEHLSLKNSIQNK